jgi:hypothetical protein
MAPPPKKSSAVPIVVILIVVVFGGLFVVGIIAAIAIPALLRARVAANETAALGTVRTMVSAQVAWASGHAGRFAQPACLAAPASCGDTEATSFLTPEVAGLRPRSGYDFGFVLRAGADDAAPAPAEEGVNAPGTPSDAEVQRQLEQIATPDTGAAAAPPPTAAPAAGRWPPAPPDHGGFAFWATPSNPGVTGTRTFCVDDTGLVRVYAPNNPWAAPSAAQPRCPEVPQGRP